MEIVYQPSFKNDLAKIMFGFGDTGTFGNSIATAIAKEIIQVCSDLDSIKPDSGRSLLDQLKSKYLDTKMFPKPYFDNGCVACNDLFFEYKCDIKGVFVVFGFYLPSLFNSPDQKKELRLFTTNCDQKLSNPKCIEFYFVVAEVVENP